MSSKKSEKSEKINPSRPVAARDAAGITEPDNTISQTDNVTNVGSDVGPVLSQVAGDMSVGSDGINLDDVTGRIDAMSKTDNSGTQFDPSVHSVDGAGEPVMTRSGNYRRKRKSTVPESTTSRKAAEYSALAFFQLGTVIFGEEWLPDEKANEKELVVGAFEDYYIDKEIVNIPAWLGLAIALGGYSTKRFTKPETKTKLQQGKKWVSDKIKNARNRLSAKTVTKVVKEKTNSTDEIPTDL